MTISPANRLAPIKDSVITRFVNLASKSENAVNLTHGEPSFPTPEHIIEASVKAMKQGFTHYGRFTGLTELRMAIADKLTHENQIPISGPDEVLIVSGTQEGMFIAAMAFLQPGDEALVLAPYYPAYVEETQIAGADPVEVPLSAANQYRVEVEDLERYVTPRTKMIWVNSPANPTGHVFSKKDLESVATIAEQHDLLVFTDEIYENLVYDGAEHVSIGSLPGMEDRVITTNGFSKTYAMTGWRIGYVAGDKQLIETMTKIHYYSVLCSNMIAQKAALAALTGPQRCVSEMIHEYDIRRRSVLRSLSEIDATSWVTPRGAFYVFPNISKCATDDESFAKRLLTDYSVATVPGSGFGRAGAGYLRISYAEFPLKVIEEGMARFRKAFTALS